MKNFLSKLTLLALVMAFAGAVSVHAVENTFQIGLSVVPDDNFAPTIPANLEATPISSSQINLTWDASTDDVAVEGYRIFRDGSIVASTTALIYSDTGLTASTSYTYEVEAFDSVPRYSGLSASVSTTTLVAPVVPPTPTPSTGGSTGGSIVLALSAVTVSPTQSSAVVSFTTNQPTQAKVFWGRTSDYELGSISGLFYNTAHAVNIDGLVAGTQYSYRVEVTNAQGVSRFATGSFSTYAAPLEEVLSNVTGFDAVPGAAGIALSWNNPDQSMFDGVRLVRSDKFFPRDILDGQIVYEGSAENVIDTDVVVGTTYYYSIFARDTAGVYTSGALAKARIAPAGEIIITPESKDPFINIPIIDNVHPVIAGLSLVDFDFYQDGKKIVNIGNQIGIDGSKNVTISLTYEKVPEILKTIAFTLADPDDPTQVFPFLLRVNKDKTAYEATIAPLGKHGAYKMSIVILDYKNQGLKKLEGNLKAFVFGSSADYTGSQSGISVMALILFLFLLLLILLLKRRNRREDHLTRPASGVAAFLVAVALMAGIVLGTVSPAVAAFNPEINYQGKLTDSLNAAVADGTYEMEFNLYTEAAGVSPAIWTESLTGSNEVQVTNGLFSVMLGSTSPLTSVDFNQTLYLGVTIGADAEMTPRKVLGAVPAAFIAGTSTVALSAQSLNGVSEGQFFRNDTQNSTSTSNTFLNILQSGAGKIAEFFGAAGKSVLALLSNGNVGVGTTTPSAKFSIHANNGDTNTALFTVASSTASATTTHFTVLANGNVGIGTSAPTNKFTISNDNPGDSTLIELFNPNTASGATGKLAFSLGSYNSAGQIFFGNTNVGAEKYFSFQLMNSGGNPNHIMRITGGGNVGIGTTSPYAKLSVVGQTVSEYFTATSTTATSTLPNLFATNLRLSGRLYDSTNSAGTNGMILQTDGSSTHWVATSSLGFAGYSDSDVNAYIHASTTIPKLYTANTFTALQRFNAGILSYASSTIGDGTQTGGLTISGGATTTGNAYFAGNVGIGITNPTEKFQVGSAFKVSSTGTTTIGSIGFKSYVAVTSQNALTVLGDIELGRSGGDRTIYVGTAGMDSSPNNLILRGGNGGPIDYSSGTAGGNVYIAGGTPQGTGLAGNVILGYNGTTFVGNVGIGTTSPYEKLSVVGTVVASNFVGTTTATSTFGGNLAINGTGTTTSNGGFDISAGCYAIGGNCLQLGSGLSGSGYTGGMAYWTGSGSLSATSAPTVSYLVATSTSATSTFAFDVAINGALQVVQAGNNTVSVGYLNSATGLNAIALGSSNTSSGSNSLTVGMSNTGSASSISTAFGRSNTASGNGSSAFGYNNTSSNTDTSAFGRSNTASGNTSSAFGYGNTTSATNASAFGSSITNAIANSTMVGPSNTSKITILSTGETKANFFTATSSTASTFPYASTTALTVSGSFYNSSLTAGRVPFITTAGRMIDSANMTYDGTYFSIGGASPVEALNVLGNIALSSGADRTIRMTQSSSNVNGYNLKIAGGDAGDSFDSSYNGGSVFIYGGNKTDAGQYGNVILAHDGSSSFGNVGIGTTSPYAKLSVAGQTVSEYFTATSTTATSTLPNLFATNLRLSGHLYDSVNSAGTNGMILQTNGSAATWVATSSLGFTTYTNADVNSYIHASSTIPKTYTANTFTALQTLTGGLTTNALTLGSLNGPLQANGGVISATTSIGVLYGGTGLTSAPSYGQVLLGNASGGYTLTATSSLGLTSQWTTVGSNINYATGNVGIGTTSPYAKLSVVGQVVGEYFTATSTTGRSVFSGKLLIGTTTTSFPTGFGLGAGVSPSTYITDASKPDGAGDLSGTTYYVLGVVGSKGTNSVSGFGSSGENGSAIYLRTGDGGSGVDQGGNGGDVSILTGAGGTSAGVAGSYGNLYLARYGGKVALGGNTNSATLLAVNGSSYFSGSVGIGTTSPYAKLSVVGQTVSEYFTATSTTATSTLPNLFATNLRLSGRLYDSANSAGTNGMVLQTNGSAATWVATSSLGLGSGTVSSGTTGQFPYYAANGTTLTATSTIFLATDGNVGIGITNPSGKLDVVGDVYLNAFGLSGNSLIISDPEVSLNSSGIDIKIGDGQGSGNSTIFRVSDVNQRFTFENGSVGIGTTSPWRTLSVNGSSDLGTNALAGSFTATSTATSTFAGSLAVTEVNATSTFAGGIDLSDGCFAIDGVCLGGSSYGDTDVNSYIHASTTIPKTYTANAFTNTNTFAGNVGIGTTSPFRALSVESETGVIFKDSSGSNFETVDFGSIVFRGDDSRFVFGSTNSPLTNSAPFYMSMANDELYSNFSKNVFSGNVGIGTTSPYAKLSIHANNGDTNTALFTIASSTASATTTHFTVLNNGNVGIGTASPDYMLSVADYGSTHNFYVQSNGNVGYRDYITNVSNNARISTYNNTVGLRASGTGNDQLLLTSSGFVGIGTTSPFAKLSVAGGDIHVGGIITSTSTTATSTLPNLFATNLRLSGRFYDSVNSAGTNGMILQTDGSSTHWVATSSLGLGSGTIGSGTTGQFPYYAGNGTTLTATSTIFLGTDGEIGIGTTNPIAKLDVQGTFNVANGDTNFNVSNGNINLRPSNSSGVVTINGASDESIFTATGDSAAGTSLVKIGDASAALGSFRFIVDQANSKFTFGDGSVGIGTTSPYAKLSVVGQTVSEYFTATSTTATSTLPNLFATNLRLSGRLYDSANSVGTNGMILQTNGSAATWVATSSLGITTSAAGSTGQIQFNNADAFAASSELTYSGGVFKVGTGGAGAFVITNSGGGDEYVLYGDENDGTSFLNGSNAGTIAIGKTSASYGLDIASITHFDNDVYVDGNVGIGTTSPVNLLTLQKDYNSYAGIDIFNSSTGVTAGTKILLGTNDSYTEGTYGGMYWNNSGFIASGLIQPNSLLLDSSGANGMYIVSHHAAGDIKFGTGGSAAGNERMRITSAGNIGIGTTSPYAKLSVVGEVVASHFTATSTTATSTFTNLAVTNKFMLAPVVLVKPDGSQIPYGQGTTTDIGRGNALSSAVTASDAGDKIILNGSTYTLSSSITLDTSTSLVGVGKPTIRSTFTGSPTITIQNSSTTVSGINILTSDTGIGYIGGSTMDIEGVEISDVNIQPLSSTACAIAWGVSCASGAGSDHSINATIRDSVLNGGGSSNFGIRVQLASGSRLQLINNEVFGATDGVYFGGSSGAIVDIMGGYYTSTLDPITSGGSTIYVNGAKARGLSGGTNADLYEDGGNIIAINTDYTSAGENVQGDHRMPGSLIFSRGSDLANLFADSLGFLRTNDSLIVDDNIGVGTTSPYAKLSVVGEVVASHFTATSTTATSTFNGNAQVKGNLQIGSSSIYLRSGATSTFDGGINLSAGCFSVNGVCVGGGSYGDTDVNSYIHASTTIPKTYTANTFSGIQTYTDKLGIGSVGNGRLTVDYTNTDYTNSGGANSHIQLKNASASGSTSLYSEINGSPVMKIRSNYLGDLTWVSYATDPARGHYFYVGGDYPTGSAKMKIAPNGVSIGSEVSGDSPAQLLKVIGTTEQVRVAYDSSNYYSTLVGSSGGVAYDAVGSGAAFSFADNVGIGTTSPYAKLAVVGQVVGEYFTATSTTATSTIAGGFDVGSGGLTYDWYTGVTSIASLQTGNLNFDTDAGAVSWVDLPILSASSGTVESYTTNIGGSPLMTMYGESNGAAGATNLRVGIGSTSPYARLTVQADAGLSTRSAFAVASSTGESLFTVLGNGSVGIGTTSPYAKLSVVGDVVADRFMAVSSATSTFAGGINVSPGATTYPALVATAGNTAGTVNTQEWRTSTGLLGAYMYNTTNTVTGLTLGGGNVTAGDFKVLATNSSEWFKVSGGTTSFNANGGIMRAGPTDLGARFNFSAVSDSLPILAARGYSGGTSDIVRVSSPSVTTGDYFKVQNDGKIGIGTTTPWKNLSVVGTVGLSSSLSSATVGNYLCINNTTYEVTSGTTCSASSERFKDNINPIAYGLDQVLALNPVSFKYKSEVDPNDATRLGFIAEEVMQIVPELVAIDKDGLPESVDYAKLTPVLVQAIQDLNQKVETLTSDPASLDSTISSTTLALIASTTADTLASSSPAFIARIATAVIEYIQSMGEWALDKLTAKIVYTDRIETQVAAVSTGLEMTDQATGQIFCVGIKNGDWDKTPGPCGTTATSTAQVEEPAEEPTDEPVIVVGDEPLIETPAATSTPEVTTDTVDTASSTPSSTDTSGGSSDTTGTTDATDTTPPPTEPTPASEQPVEETPAEDPAPASEPAPEIAPEPEVAPEPAPESATEPEPAPESAPQEVASGN